MRISIRMEGLTEVATALRQFGERAEAELDRAVQAQAVDVRSGIQRRIQRGPKTGETYRRRTITHQASAPGEAPATDTGALVSSITFRRDGRFAAIIESRLPYASMLEFGTARMAPRPAWTPEIEAKRSEFVRRVTDAIRRAQG